MRNSESLPSVLCARARHGLANRRSNDDTDEVDDGCKAVMMGMFFFLGHRWGGVADARHLLFPILSAYRRGEEGAHEATEGKRPALEPMAGAACQGPLPDGAVP
ncbi:hypothetical protein VFPFJ_07209 [Purpureocillium lilacinum]|uniref:Uncharacterized protein n=1 Tax=Purpureocillium lilacinum TaxID=33203 RepID=A0A179HFF4_PURLI|nr:hypothetical protein VFPFJ_07209 [Purpureocillium lilacinum]OAQ88744.1 hypothetical protein VFPFJ_07209 [Purpureocillium lilacinum]